MKLVILIGPPGSGKSTYAAKNYPDYVRVNQDAQGKVGHMETFLKALDEHREIIVDRMNFDEAQRIRYIQPALAMGYTVKMVVLHVPRATCLSRMIFRAINEGHETVKNEKDANSALNVFFSKYEKPKAALPDVEVELIYPEVTEEAVVIDLDGTLCNVDHRLHFVRCDGKKNWKQFFFGLSEDKPNPWCKAIIDSFVKADGPTVVFASGRPDDFQRKTEDWLTSYEFSIKHLYMRCRGDHRADYIAKEIILDFEILTRFKPLFFIDDRKQVADLWRRRGFVCLGCAEGDF